MHFGARAGCLLGPLVVLLLLAPIAQASVQSELAFHRGVIAYGEERWDEAKQHFERVLQEDSEDSAALHYLALIADQQGDSVVALDYYDRALAIDPEDPELVLDRGTLLLDMGRVDEARAAFARVIELDPDNARAQLLAGMAAYREGDHAAATPYLDRAGELDPSLRDEARYYTGLSQAVLGNVQAAASAFSDAATQSPLSPLGKSAQNFQQALERPDEPARPWRASLTAGMEVDSNPLLRGTATAATPILNNRETDGAGVVRPSASYRFFEQGDASATVGYDGYWSFHTDAHRADLQTHNPWLSGAYRLGPVSLGLRFDYAYTMFSITKPLRSLYRLVPSMTYVQGDWGASLLYYQFNAQRWRNGAQPKTIFDRDSLDQVGGFTQFFFLPEPFTYVRIGIEGAYVDTDGTEFKYNGVEASVGAGYDFDYDISFAWLYEFDFRNYDNPSVFAVPTFTTKRNDYEHQVTAEISKMLDEHWEVSLGMALTFNDSNISFYNIDRQVGGAYLTYNF